MKQKLCGCCEGARILTPQAQENRPGLPALAYRVGIHATFLETMKARLSGADYPALAGLTTRDAGDPSIALLDAWATVADVLTFYQERIANEGYLRTATERRSILELARLMGYDLRPGLAASVFLAFELEKDAEVEIPAGTRAQSLPGPGELPQPFETAAPLTARAVWNALKPRLMKPQNIVIEDAELNTTNIYVEGVSTNLKPNDPLLLLSDPGACADTSAYFRKVQAVEPDIKANRTRIVVQGEVCESDSEESEEIRTETELAADEIFRLRKTVKAHLDVETYNVAGTSMANRIVPILEATMGQLEPGLSRHKLTAILDGALAPIREDFALAETRGYTRLSSWLSGMVDALENERASLEESDDAITPNNAAQVSQSSGPTNTQMLPKRSIPLERLRRSPSDQPANALQLPRSPKTVFAEESAVPLDLLTRFSPILKRSLYRVWSRIPVVVASTSETHRIQSIQALRIKAAPFGHNAPLEPITDDDGRVLRYREWQLAKTIIATKEIHIKLANQEIRATLPSAFQKLTPLLATIAVQGDEEHQMPLGTAIVSHNLDEVQQEMGVFDLGEVQATIMANYHVARASEVGFPRDALERISFSFQSASILLSTVDVTLSQQREGLYISLESGVGNTFERNVGQGETLCNRERKVGIEFSNSGGDLNITIEIPVLGPRSLDTLTLDAVYDRILPGSCVVVERPNPNDQQEVETHIFKVEQVQTVSKADYGITGRVTQLTLDDKWLYPSDVDLSVVRNTTVYAQGETLPLSEAPISTTDVPVDVAGNTIELDGLYDGLEPGRWLIVAGERTDILDDYNNIIPGVWDAEVVMLAAIEQTVDENLSGDTPHTTLVLANSLAYTYKLDTVTIHGNVVKATHGETREEVLGSGDGSQALQSFPLKRSPLTHLAAATPAGAESTLEVRVDQVRWHEADRLVDQKPKDRVFFTRTDDAAQTRVIFGDGEHGARLPTGIENVRAVYRMGIGKDGNVAAGKISMLATRPLGVKGVINPKPATGGADRESRDQARCNVPVGVKALDRLVSVQDYADFCRAFAGIGKASAVRLNAGHHALVHVTLAGADNVPIDTQSDLYRNLVQAIHRHGDPYLPVQIDLYEPVFLVVAANVRLEPDYLWEAVAPKIQAALLTAFGFEQRELGQDALLSELISAIQSVQGVAYTDVDLYQSIAKSDTENTEILTQKLADLTTAGAAQRIIAELARWQDHELKPAQLAYLTPEIPETLILTELT